MSGVSRCFGYSRGPAFGDQPAYSPYQRYSHQSIKNRYHPTTYSKESSEEEMPAANMPAPQVVPQIQYAYQGGDGFSHPDDQDQGVQIYQGEVLNHVRQQPSSSSAITPRPHPVYQQQLKPQGGQPAQPEIPQQSPQGLPPQVFPPPGHNLQEITYDPHHGYVNDHGYPDHGYPEHHGFDGYHYPHPVHHPPPPPQKSKASQSAYAYYYIGRHLWYVPLYFSIYFIAYVGLLVLKSIARHKVLLPQLSENAALAAAAGNRRQIHENFALRSIEEGKQKYYMR
ncbi:hypothetical protein GE061_010729 [Apolygus lucorum]|uniref:Uncharacterized protein n=1 Tax=Apolygus lucorum TaxID=248454 RepID=A0A6A4JSQ2_APOLU|nr:hypothetical protein GE061_010729 [Apolygus lucorum]